MLSSIIRLRGHRDITAAVVTGVPILMIDVFAVMLFNSPRRE